MRKILRIAKREYQASVQTKGFLIGLILAPIFMSGGFIAVKISEKAVDTRDRHVAIVDRSGVIADSLVQAAKARNAAEVHDQKSGKKVRPAYILEVIEPDQQAPEAQRLALSDEVRAGRLHAFVEIGAGIVHPRQDSGTAGVTYYSHNPTLDELRQWLQWPVNDRLRQLRLADANIDPATVPDLFDWTGIAGMGLVSADTQTGEIQKARRTGEFEAIGLPIIMQMMMFLMIMMGAAPLLNATMEEKSQRIAEVLLGAVRPFQLMMGKLIGGVAVSLTAAAVYVLGGILAIRYMGFGAYVPYDLLPWFFAYMIAAVIMVGAIMAAVGSACNDAKEAQSVNFPAMLPVIIPMFVMMPVLKEPNSAFSTWLSFVPSFTPLLMLVRQSSPGGIPIWQPWAGLIGVLALTFFAVWAGSRVFRVSILMQGTPARWRNIVRWAIRG